LSESYIQLPPDGTGKKVRAIYRGDLGVYEEVQLFKDIETENPVYVVAVSASSVSANKHHLTIWNGSTYRLRVLEIVVSMHETATVSGYIMQYLVYRASAVSGGTALSIDRLDPDDPAPPSGISAYTGATVTITGIPLAIFTLNPEETGGDCYRDFKPPKPIVVKPGTGLTIQQYATAGVGLFNAVIYFSVEGIKP
jgi:uncharacterized membrane protein YwzB